VFLSHVLVAGDSLMVKTVGGCQDDGDASAHASSLACTPAKGNLQAESFVKRRPLGRQARHHPLLLAGEKLSGVYILAGSG
jgi:hypothetical protein